jgi:hypothetical protein
MEIVKERLEREFNLALIATAPSVEYRVFKTNGEMELVDNPADLPQPQSIDYIEEPYFRIGIERMEPYAQLRTTDADLYGADNGWTLEVGSYTYRISARADDGYGLTTLTLAKT